MVAALSSPLNSTTKETSESPSTLIRETVRDLLLSSAAYHSLDPEKRSEIAKSMVNVCQTAVSLLAEEANTSEMVGALAQPLAHDEPKRRATLSSPAPVAMAQNAGEQFSGVAAQRVADTTRNILNAVSFPRFVAELINGVFKALIDSNQQQMHSYVELIKNVAASTDGFADANLAPDRARQWLVETFPGAFTLEGGPDEDTDPRDVAEETQEARIRLKDGGSMPSEEALRTTLGIAPGETIPSGDPERTMVPFARRALARQRQQMLATMVMMGMQRIVIESGRLNASMRFHIDTRSAANSEEGSRFDFQNKAEASGKFGVGPWGVEAKMTNTIGYCSTSRDQTTEEMNTELDLNSSVELYFKTDYVPLDRLAGVGQVDRIKVNTLNPDAEAKAAIQAREQRTASARKAETERSAETQRGLQRTPEPGSSSPPTPARTTPPAATPATGTPTTGTPSAATPATGAPTTETPQAGNQANRAGTGATTTTQPANTSQIATPAPPARR